MIKPLFLISTAFLLFIKSSYAEQKINIGWIGPLTGDAAVLGVDSVEVAKEIFSEVNKLGGVRGHRLELLAEDDQYQAAKTLSAYNRLVHVNGVKVIFVLSYGGMLAIAPLAEHDEVILINPLDCDEELAGLPKNSLCVAKRTEDLGIMNAEHALRHGNVPAAIIYFDGDPFLPKVAKATRDTFKEKGADVVMFEGGSEKMDLRTLITKAKEKKARSLFFYGYDSFGVGMRQARQLGVEAKFYALTLVHSDGFRTGAGDAVNGTYTAGWFAPRSPRYQRFLEEYKAKIGREPLLEVATVPTYDVAKIIVSALEKILDEQSGKFNLGALRDKLYAVKDYDGLSGTITMDEDGAVRSLRVGMYSYQHGEFRTED